MDIFRTVIFLMHFLTACVLTFWVWLRCGQDNFSYHMVADTHVCPAGQACTAPYVQPSAHLNTTCYTLPKGNENCNYQGLPLYDQIVAPVGWHLFAILAHFEWVSTAFAFYYIRSRYQPYSWIVSSSIVFVGTLLCMPWAAHVYWNEVLLFWATFIGCAGIFYTFQDVVPDRVSTKGKLTAETAALLFPKITRESKRDLSAEYGRVHTRLSGECDRSCSVAPVYFSEEPALRMLEYALTGSELFIAVLNIFVPHAPAFFTIVGYGLIFACNLSGVMVHYGMIMMNDKSAVEIPVAELLPMQPVENTAPVAAKMRTFDVTYLEHPVGMAVYRSWGFGWWPACTCWPSNALYSKAGLAGFWSPEPHGPQGDAADDGARMGWGTPSSLRMSSFLNSWATYIVALAFVFYEGNLLYSRTAPGFVVASGWILILVYSSFGFWATAAWYWPSLLRWRVMGTCFGCSDHHETDVDAVFARGLDVLSLAAKLSIVYNLSFGFIFMGGGVC